MSTIVETLNGSGYGSTIASKVTFEDFKECIVDSKFKESVLIEKFDLKLNEVEKEGNLQKYEETLKNDKKLEMEKVTLWKMLSTPYGINKEKWDNVFKAKFSKTTFKPEPEEYLDKVRDVKSPTGYREITKVRLSNNLKTCSELELSHVITFMLENFDVTEELKTEFNTVLSEMESVGHESKEIKTDKQNKLINGHVIKANSENFNIASEFMKNRFRVRELELKNIVNKHAMSINFLTWKLKRIQIRKNKTNIVEGNNKAVDMNIKLMEKAKKNTNFASLMNIANKWNL